MMALSVVFMLLGCATTQQDVRAADYVARELLNGSDAKFYVGTADTATTFNTSDLGTDGTGDDTYRTNRTYVNLLSTTVTPLGTNSITGALNPGFERAVPLWTKSDSGIQDNLALAIKFQGNTELTNTVALTFVRSGDGGSTFDVNGHTFAVTVDPVGTVGGSEISATVVTNLSSTFLQGASHIKLWKVVTAANVTDDAIFTLHSVKVSGWQP